MKLERETGSACASLCLRLCYIYVYIYVFFFFLFLCGCWSGHNVLLINFRVRRVHPNHPLPVMPRGSGATSRAGLHRGHEEISLLLL